MQEVERSPCVETLSKGMAVEVEDGPGAHQVFMQETSTRLSQELQLTLAFFFIETTITVQ